MALADSNFDMLVSQSQCMFTELKIRRNFLRPGHFSHQRISAVIFVVVAFFRSSVLIYWMLHFKNWRFNLRNYDFFSPTTISFFGGCLQWMFKWASLSHFFLFCLVWAPMELPYWALDVAGLIRNFLEKAKRVQDMPGIFIIIVVIVVVVVNVVNDGVSWCR